MTTTLLFVGKTTDAHIEALCQEYLKRLTHYLPVKVQVIPELRNTKAMTPEQQKQAEGELILRAVPQSAELILLDEPIAGLDPMAMTEMYRMIADLNQEGVAVVMVSHDVSAAVQYATHILHMGKTTSFFGTTEAYLATPVGQQFARREGGSYGDWSPKTAWDAPDIGKILDVRAAPDARSVLGARGVSLNRNLTANRRRGGIRRGEEGNE